MTKSTVHANDVLSLILNGVALPAAYGSTLYIRAHTADPGLTADGTINECDYTGYAAVPIVRDNTGAGFTLAGTTRSNAGELTFPQCTGAADDQTITHLSINTSAAGAGRKVGKGALASPLRVTNLITPRLLVGALSYQEA